MRVARALVDKFILLSGCSPEGMSLRLRGRIAMSSLIACFSMLASHGISQETALTDTLIMLPAVSIITSKPVPVTIGERTDFWADSALDQTSRSLDQLLRRSTGVFLKSYGSGGIATLSVRGSSAGQTAVTWNDIQIMNPMLGLADLSIIPLAAFDKATFSYGGNSSVSGSGAIGGLIALESSRTLRSGLSASVSTTLGSFGLWNQNVTLGLGNNKLKSRTTYSHHEATNDFNYTIRPDLPERTQKHSSSRQDVIVQDVNWTLDANQQVDAHIWWQKTTREIPPTTVQNASEAVQDDENIRLSTRWGMTSDVVQIDGSIGYLYDKINYMDPLSQIAALSKASTVFAQAKGAWTIDPAYSLSGGLTHYYITANIDSYEDRVYQNRTSIHATHVQHFGKGDLQVNLRQELVDGKFSPFVFAVGGDWQAYKWLAIKGKISRDYRLPGLNDLYWVPGGNPDLESEKSWSQELTLDFHHQFTSERVMFTATAFNRNVKNWVLWSVKDGNPFWSAQNIAEVHSRGIELRFGYQWHTQKWLMETNFGYDFVRSTNEVAVDNPMIEAGEQLIYVPQHTALFKVNIGWQDLRLSYDSALTGQVSTDRGDILPSYYVGNLRLEYIFRRSKYSVKPFAEAHNIWNENYRVIQYRPMPGRNYQFGIQLQLN